MTQKCIAPVAGGIGGFLLSRNDRRFIERAENDAFRFCLALEIVVILFDGSEAFFEFKFETDQVSADESSSDFEFQPVVDLLDFRDVLVDDFDAQRSAVFIGGGFRRVAGQREMSGVAEVGDSVVPEENERAFEVCVEV